MVWLPSVLTLAPAPRYGQGVVGKAAKFVGGGLGSSTQRVWIADGASSASVAEIPIVTGPTYQPLAPLGLAGLKLILVVGAVASVTVYVMTTLPLPDWTPVWNTTPAGPNPLPPPPPAP